MKKLLAKLTALAFTAVMTSSLTANADDLPTFYFTPRAETDSDGTLVISRQQLADGLTVTTDIFVDDPSKTCWSLDPKWKCSTPFIQMTNIVNPQKPYVPYAYAEEKDGELTTIRHHVTVGQDTDCNTMYFVCDLGTLYTDGSPLTPYGENTYDYALTNFDLVFDRNIPYGEYDVYFLEKAEDYPQQRYTTVAMRTSEGSNIIVPNVRNLHIKITGANKGDVNNDGLVDANDASLILSAYSLISTGSDSGLNDDESYAADVNSDNIIDSNDASAVLAYYSYAATGGELSLEDYIK